MRHPELETEFWVLLTHDGNAVIRNDKQTYVTDILVMNRKLTGAGQIVGLSSNER